MDWNFLSRNKLVTTKFFESKIREDYRHEKETSDWILANDFLLRPMVTAYYKDSPFWFVFKFWAFFFIVFHTTAMIDWMLTGSWQVHDSMWSHLPFWISWFGLIPIAMYANIRYLLLLGSTMESVIRSLDRGDKHRSFDPAIYIANFRRENLFYKRACTSPEILLVVLVISGFPFLFQQVYLYEDRAQISEYAFQYSAEHVFTITGIVYLTLAYLGIYTISLSVWKTLITYLFFRRICNDRSTKIHTIPYHPDGCGGLASIGTMWASMNLMVFVVGIITFTVFFNTFSLGSEAVYKSLMPPAVYLCLFPLHFFLLTRPVTQRLVEDRYRLLEGMATAVNLSLVSEEVDNLDSYKKAPQDLVTKLNYYAQLPNNVYDKKTLRNFAISYGSPILVSLVGTQLPYILGKIF